MVLVVPSNLFYWISLGLHQLAKVRLVIPIVKYPFATLVTYYPGRLRSILFANDTDSIFSERFHASSSRRSNNWNITFIVVT